MVVKKYRMTMNLDRVECMDCEGTFMSGEVVCELEGYFFCEKCFEDHEDHLNDTNK